MRTIALRRIPFALAACAVIAGLGVYAISAGQAGASASFYPRLTAASKTAKFGKVNAAPYTETATAKRTTAVAKAKTGKRLQYAPGSNATVAPASSSGELASARAILAQKIAQYPILQGATVEFGDARGYQAICYYRSGRIVISRTHTASLDRIISHEVWHIIDWRDNGRIDWGESVPPK